MRINRLEARDEITVLLTSDIFMGQIRLSYSPAATPLIRWAVFMNMFQVLAACIW
jgi:hypothetical protein